jgi:hypothetical protein
VWTLAKPLPNNFQGDVFPHANRLLWLVVLTQNVIAQLVTGPPSEWNEVAFNIYYLLLFAIAAVIFFHYQCMNAAPSRGQPSRSLIANH